MNDKKLCEWLRANSSGTYRPSSEAAERIEFLLQTLNEIAALSSVNQDEASLMAQRATACYMILNNSI